MIRLGQLCALALAAATIGSGCTNVDGKWVPRQSAAAQKNKTDRAIVTGQDVPQSNVSTPPEAEAEAANPDPDPSGDALVDDSTETVADFVRRLQMQQESESDAEVDTVAAAQSLDTDDIFAGTASTAANMGVAVPEPGQESVFDVGPKRPEQATEAPRIESVSVVSAVPGLNEEIEAKTLSANEPLDATTVAEEFSIRKYIKMLEEALCEHPSDVNLQWLLSTMHLVMGEEEKATELSDGISVEPAELLRDAVRLFADMRQLLVDPSHPADDTLAALETLRTKLRDRSELELPVVALCSRVRTFGVYDDMPADQFVAFQTNRAVVYTEVKHFLSHKTEEGQYETLLAGRLELLSTDGHLVWHHEEDSIKEVSRQRREDFFLAQLVTFPSDLAPGDYVLKVMIQDLLCGKANEAHVEFTVRQRQFTSTTP